MASAVERAVVVGAGGGIGAALVAALAANGTMVHAFARQPLAARDGVETGCLDVTSEADIADAFAALPEGVRLVIVATGLLHDRDLQPEKSMRGLDPGRLARSFAVNAIGPALVAKHAIPRLPRTGGSVFVAISAKVGSIADNRLGGWYGYRASKAALNQFIRTLAIEARRSRPDLVVAALHPGTVETDLSAPFRGNVEPDRLFTPGQAADKLLRVIDGLKPADSGGFFGWDGSPLPF